MGEHPDAPGIEIVLPPDLSDRLQNAVGYFWRTRTAQRAEQGKSGGKDRGSRSAVTGGRQMDGFANLIMELLDMNGVPPNSVFLKTALELPGYFRPTKKWDVLVVHGGELLVAMEMKSQVGPSFGNNFNSRTEEAVGSATDIWTAYREGAFGEARRPWLGYLFLLEDCHRSQSPVRVQEPHFSVFPEFKNASYAIRYQEMCHRLLKEKLYTEVAFVMARTDDVTGSTLRQPVRALAFLPFVQSLLFSVKVAMQSTYG